MAAEKEFKLKEIVREAAEVIRKGGIILYPTDTVWGIGCDATNTEAIKKINALKNRPDSKNLLIVVKDDAMLNKYVEDVPAIAWDLMDHSDKPITIVYETPKNLPEELLAEDGSIGIRIIRDGFANQLMNYIHLPIVSTSANLSGDPTPKSFKQVADPIKKGVDYVVKSLETSNNPPSSIVKVGTNGEIKIIRK